MINLFRPTAHWLSLSSPSNTTRTLLPHRTGTSTDDVWNVGRWACRRQPPLGSRRADSPLAATRPVGTARVAVVHSEPAASDGRHFEKMKRYMARRCPFVLVCNLNKSEIGE